MILYKYRDISNLNCFKYTLDSLKNKYLYFSRPSELNDPFDCQIQYDLTASDEEYLQWIEKNCSRIPPGNLLLTVDGIKKLVKQGKAISGLAQYSHSIVEINHVLSLTSDCYNASMWAKYAGNYNGICIGYNVDDSDLSFLPTKIEIDYLNIKYDLLIQNRKIIFEQIVYSNENHPVCLFKDRKSQEQNVLYSLTHKKECWEVEKEYRAIIHNTDFFIPFISNLTIKVFYDDSLLEEVIFGNNVPSNIIVSIRKIIESSYHKTIKFYIVIPDLNEGVFRKVQI